jgi:hypothetical protein
MAWLEHSSDLALGYPVTEGHLGLHPPPLTKGLKEEFNKLKDLVHSQGRQGKNVPDGG